MSSLFRTAAVKYVKPILSDATWDQLRTLRGRNTGRPDAAAPAASGAQELRHRLRRMNLTELAQHFGTDKYGIHRYTPHYERHVQHLRPRAFSMLEIGIGGYARKGQGGASLRMWKHFFPKARIVGLDIQDKSFVKAARITTIQGSQVDKELLTRLCEEHGPFEFIVDDGSHRPEHVRETFRILFPLLADGGVYAIEDVQTSYWPKFGGSLDLQDRSRTMGLVKDLLDGLNYEEWSDESYEPTYSDLHVVAVHAYHNLVILEKGDNREGTNRRRRWLTETGDAASSDGPTPAASAADADHDV